MSIILLVSNVFQLISITSQTNFNKHKKSIYGLSYDMVILSLLSTATSIISTILYIFNSRVHQQYEFRFRQYPNIPVSYSLLVVEVFLLLGYIVLVRQLITYHTSRNINQGISNPCMLLLSGFSISFIYLVYIVNTNEPMYLLDIVDFIWMISKISNSLKYIPQISMNWFGECVIGLHNRWLSLQALTVLFVFISRYYTKLRFWEIPVNYPSWLVIGSHIACVIILWRQSLIYKENKPKLKYAE